MSKQKEECCGHCVYMLGEDVYGNGMCAKIFAEMVKCNDKCHEDHFVSREDARHYLAVLTQHNRWRRDQHVTNYCLPVNPTELGKAIDFVIDYTKTLMDI